MRPRRLPHQDDGTLDKGFFAAKDFSSYAAKWRMPREGVYRGHQINAMPPPASGESPPSRS